MSDINDEMKANADFAIKSAWQRYKKTLDYSEQSITIILDGILEKIYWGFSGRTDDKGENGLIFNTAIIWGSYLGEYMRLKWGGNWIIKGSDRLVSINNVEFSPIDVVYHQITSRTDSSLEGYLREVERIMYRSAIDPHQAKYLTRNLSQYEEQDYVLPARKTLKINKQVLLTIAGIGAMLLVIGSCFIGFKNIMAKGIPAFGLFAPIKSTNTNIPPEISIIITKTSTLTITQVPTITALPTYTPEPSLTLAPSRTPIHTRTATVTSTSTNTPFPTRTPTPRRSPTITTVNPTNTRAAPTRSPSPNPTRISSPTSTEISPTATDIPPTPTLIPPVVIESCDIDPSTIQAGLTVQITFSAQFSAPGYGFSTAFQSDFPGQVDCSGSDTNGDGTASCKGLSGMLPSNTTVDVVFSSSVGDCTASYSTP